MRRRGGEAISGDGGRRQPRAGLLAAALQRMFFLVAGAGVALMDMAYVGTAVAEGRLKMLAERPLRLPTGYYFVNAPGARNLHLLTLLRDWAVEAARPFRQV